MKVAIPREAIENIVKEHNISVDEATKIFLDAQDRAYETFKQELSKPLK